MSEQTAYPLSWPEGWPRTPRHLVKSSRFYVRRNNFRYQGHSMSEVCDELTLEVRRLGGKRLVISTNVRLKNDGLPYSSLKQPDDTGAAAYFQFKTPISMACDKWDRVEDNIYAIAMHIEALRGQNRWGVGSIERAFRGYTALPGIGESSGIQWWSTLGVPINSTYDQVKEAYFILVKKHHPDRNGDSELFRRVQEAWELFERSQKTS